MFTDISIESHFRIRHHCQNSILLIDWVGRQSRETIELGCTKLLQAMTALNCFNVLNDHRHVIGDWSESAEWVSNVWLPMMERAGLLKLACVKGLLDEPNACLDKTHIQVNFKTTELRLFSHYDNAFDWITNNDQ